MRAGWGHFLFCAERNRPPPLPPPRHSLREWGKGNLQRCTPPSAANPPYEYLYFGAQPPAPSGIRSKKCKTVAKSSPGEKLVSDTRNILPPRLRNTDTPG